MLKCMSDREIYQTCIFLIDHGPLMRYILGGNLGSLLYGDVSVMGNRCILHGHIYVMDSQTKTDFNQNGSQIFKICLEHGLNL